MGNLHIDPEVNQAINDMIEATKRRNNVAAHKDLLLIIPLLKEEPMIITFAGIIETSTPWSKSPELALAIAQKQRCTTPTLGTYTSEEMIALNNALCMFENKTSREYVVIYVPQSKNEGISLTRDGLPYPHDMTIEEVLAMAMIERRKE